MKATFRWLKPITTLLVIIVYTYTLISVTATASRPTTPTAANRMAQLMALLIDPI